MRTVLAAAMISALAACGGGGGSDDSAPERSTTTVERTTTTLSPTDAYLADIDRTLTFSGPDSSGPEASLELAESICGLLDTAEGVAAADAPNDSPITDAAVNATVGTMAIDTAFSADTSDDAVAVVLRAAGEHLCPEHADTIEAELEHRGL